MAINVPTTECGGCCDPSGGGSVSQLVAFASVTDGDANVIAGGNPDAYDLDGLLLLGVEGDGVRRMRVEVILPNVLGQAFAIQSASMYQLVVNSSLGPTQYGLERHTVANHSNGTPYNETFSMHGETILDPFVGTTDLQAAIYAPAYFEWFGYADPTYGEPAIIMATWV